MAFETVKRLLVGRPVQSERLGHTLLPKKIALPVFASDALSSVAYATQEIVLVLAAGGLAFFVYTPWIALAVGLLMLVVVASYRQNVHAYPSGGGDYEVTTTNFNPKVGMTVASALMVDYTLTVAVSVSSGMANLASAFPALNSNLTLICALVGRGHRGAEPARRAGVGHRVRDPHVLLRRDRHDDDHLGWHQAGDRAAPARRDGRLRDQGHRFLCGPGADVPDPARVLLRLHRPDRRGGDQQRRARVQAAQEQERGYHPGPARRHRGDHVRRRHRAGPGQPRARGEPDRHPGRLRAAAR